MKYWAMRVGIDLVSKLKEASSEASRCRSCIKIKWSIERSESVYLLLKLNEARANRVGLDLLLKLNEVSSETSRCRLIFQNQQTLMINSIIVFKKFKRTMYDRNYI